MIKPYNAARKTIKWYKKLSVHLIQIALLNAHILYKKDGGRKTFLQFQREVSIVLEALCIQAIHEGYRGLNSIIFHLSRS